MAVKRKTGKQPAKKKTSKRDATQNNGRTMDGRFTKGHTHGFHPGVSGNPGGRPRTRYLSKAASDWLGDAWAKDPSLTNAQAIIAAVGEKALRGDVNAVAWLADRTEGKPRQAIDLAVEEKERAILEMGLGLLRQTGMSDEDAARYLTSVYPEASEWIN